ncbi:MAG: hypothetical protein MUC84_11115 [Solirubrobacteraceae bacterium]|nr:hypothetical protein [Solirubrobacteraceae bacterium]
MTISDQHPPPSPGHRDLRPATEPGRRAVRALGASLVVLVAATVVLNTAGQGLAASLLGGVSVVLALTCAVLAGVAVVRNGERSPFVFGAWVLAVLVLAVLLHSLVISD